MNDLGSIARRQCEVKGVDNVGSGYEKDEPHH